MGELIVILILVGICVVAFGASWAYFTAENLGLDGSVGVLGVVVTVLMIAALIVWSRWSAKSAKVRAERTAVADWANWVVRDFTDEDVQEVAATLSTPWEAMKKWSSVGLGRLPDMAKGDPGAAPELVPSKGMYPPDRGIWEVPVGVRMRLQMTDGQKPKHFEERLDQLAVAFSTESLNAESVRVVDYKGRTICLDVRYFDPIANPVPVPVPSEEVDLAKLPTGMRDDGDPWYVPLDERNVFGAGEPGSGKSGFIRAMVAATAPAARDGYLVNLMIDLKFGIEANQMRGLLHGTATSEESALELLRWLRRVAVEQRGRYMEAHGLDKHVPTPDAPFFHLIIDEIAELLDNPETRTEFLRLLISIGRLGRALKFSMSAYTQLSNKKILDMLRDLFQVRIGMRLNSPEQMVMVYGDHRAHERGADNTRIPIHGAQGTAYVVDDTTSQIVRVRAFQVTPENLAWFAQQYPPARHPELEEVLSGLTRTTTGEDGKVSTTSASTAAVRPQAPKRRYDGDDVPDLPEVFAEINAEAEAMSAVLGNAIAEIDPEEWPVDHKTRTGSKNGAAAKDTDATGGAVLPLRKRRTNEAPPALPGDLDEDQADDADDWAGLDDWDDSGDQDSGDESA
ncbi:FtsK/SpoIIIE domain-containing protein [Nocardia sp. NPDC050408]|uniref:FtsK/SpoIIIE domain-containing protein n=1 Tax=Nocardia sp. NPDC050408 TaxID=3364319 RepID=UPI0037B3FE72